METVSEWLDRLRRAGIYFWPMEAHGKPYVGVKVKGKAGGVRHLSAADREFRRTHMWEIHAHLTAARVARGRTPAAADAESVAMWRELRS